MSLVESTIYNRVRSSLPGQKPVELIRRSVTSATRTKEVKTIENLDLIQMQFLNAIPEKH